MAATLTQKRFVGPEWCFERKVDGIRLLAFKRGGEVQLYSRNRLPQNAPEIAAAVAALPASELILDGELEWDKTAYHVFDIVRLDGRDLRASSLDERRAILETMPLSPPLHLVERVLDAEPWERAEREGWEGVIAKRRASAYEGRRSPHWLKMKCELTREFVIGGFTDPHGSRVGLGALLLGHYQGEDLLFAGRVGTGFDNALLRELRARLEPLEIASPPFAKAIGLPRRAHFVRPEIVVRVSFVEWTAHGKLRHPRLVAVC
jgi:ATP-dependent DNA ligase